ncbi:unnamed protein product [Effrenium voratum]|nr:unnamed protein product [Effrenium voratum]
MLLLSLPLVLAQETLSGLRLRLSDGLSEVPEDAFASGISPWQVEELAFFSDLHCTQPAATPSLDSSVGNASARYQAFDGDNETSWTGACSPGVDSWKICQESWQQGAWLAAFWSTPSPVGCLLLQHQGAELALDRWSNSAWQPWRHFAFSSGVVQLRLPQEAVCNSEMATVAEGGFVRPHCGPQMQWRLRSQGGSWTLYELEFFVDSLCTEAAEFGLPLASQGQLQLWRRFADGDFATAWSASGDAWAGAAFNRSWSVRCVRVAQLFPGSSQALEVWNGTAWAIDQVLSPSGGLENFEYLPPRQLPSGSQWRLINMESIKAAWAVHELSFHGDAACTVGLPVAEILSGDAPKRRAELGKAFDGNVASAWVSGCAPCQARSAWLGQRFQVGVLVRCVNLRHAESFDYRPQSLELERWEEGWRSVALFNSVLGGALQLSPNWGAPRTRFVVSNAASTLGGWRLTELRLYRDEACVSRVRGVPFAIDGNSAEADLALDGSLDTYYFVDCCRMHGGAEILGCAGCQQEEVWVGVLLPQNDSVSCLQLIQRGETRVNGESLYSAQEISLMQWNGFGYERVYSWKNVPSDDWVEMGVGREIAALGAARGCSDIPEWSRCNASEWNCSGYKLTDSCNETFQSDADCEGITMALACKASCCLCGANNPESCGTGGQGGDGLPEWLPAAIGGGVGLVCFAVACCWCCRRWRAKQQ